ncbi:regulator of volume decrease after cellular swelling-domain-containing protein [Durotheca rogersii]|uniref:regulator of volume decrease after cellular swelling-domain-containing protein n=1 Tax=Durotheca rogersii TaxID=419775 RepID=UPI0022212945|nr:regulator of volume decrease after cellular swelling-domain-containing protein [Durotheca rogersii]KAI5867205.1 regulator of volume decrease after cellular swelling-domain-containing protein [Durotheca rogersii]
MPPTVIRTCPSADDDFQPLSEYQAQTPNTFFDSKPILYYHDENVKAWVSGEQHEQLYFFSKASGDDDLALYPTPPESRALKDGDKHYREEKVEVFVASHKLIIFSHKSGTGIEIPYPSITLHAIKNFRLEEGNDDASSKFISVYMQLELSSSGDDEDEGSDPLELFLIPYKASPRENPSAEGAPAIDPLSAERATALFNQISACSNLHPDPADEEEEDGDDEFDRIVFEGNVEGSEIDGLPGVLRGDSSGGLPPPMPGSSGWITADNVDQYFDADGNWIGREGVSGELGDGAGRVRGRDEVEQDGVNGLQNGEDVDPKRPRTE